MWLNVGSLLALLNSLTDANTSEISTACYDKEELEGLMASVKLMKGDDTGQGFQKLSHESVTHCKELSDSLCSEPR